MDHLRGGIGANTSFSHPMDQEDRLQHEKTRNLMKRLNEIERRAAEMRKETERLKILKDEAKQKVIDAGMYVVVVQALFKLQVFLK